MTFTSLFLAMACSLEVSCAFPAGPAAYTTITNTIDIMGAVESAYENNAGGYRGQNIYSTHGDAKITSNSKMPEVGTHLRSPDALNPSKTSSQVNFPSRLPFDSGNRAIVNSAEPSYFSFVTTSSGPSISISSDGPNVRTVSYSTPGRIFVSHGSPGSSYVISTHHLPQTQTQTQTAIPSLSNSSGENLGDKNRGFEANNTFGVDDKMRIPEISHPSASSSSSSSFSSSSSSSSFSSSSSELRNHAGVTVLGIPVSRYSVYSEPNPKLVISGSVDSPSIIDLVGVGPSPATYGLYGNGHPAYAAAYRNLQAARQVVDGISAAVLRAVNINLAGIGSVQL